MRARSAPRLEKERTSNSERIYSASQWILMWLRFRKHNVAVLGLVVIVGLYFVAVFHGFLAPYGKATRSKHISMAPQRIRFWDGETFSVQPFVYGIKSSIDLDTMARIHEVDQSVKYPVHLLVHGDEWSLFGFIASDLHLFGVEPPGTILLMGTDDLGRCLFSRTLYGAAISLSIGLIGVFTSFVLGSVLGGVSGYYGGAIDNVIQRIIEFLLSVPAIPLWMALSAAVPRTWSPIKTYFAITLILSLRGWCGLARVVRSKLLELREEDFVMAAQLVGSSDWRIITRHLLPAFMSYLIVSMTMSIPNMILGETALSFLGLGLRPPVVSWGVLLQQAQNIGAVVSFPWLLWPGGFVIVTVLSLNFMGDCLRDAADPYAR